MYRDRRGNKYQRKNIKSGIPGAVPNHKEVWSDPMSPSLQYEHWLPTWHQLQHKLIWGSRVKPGHFDCTGPRRKSSREKRGLIILSDCFLCLIFPSWQERFKLWTQKKFMLPRTVLVLVMTPAAGPHNLHFPHHYQQFSEKNNREDTFSSPVCEEPSQTESLIDESSFQTWRKRSKGRDYLARFEPHAEHRAGTSGQPAHVTDGESEKH